MIKLKYKNKKIEKICNDEVEMKKYFGYDTLLVESLMALLHHFDSMDSIYDFKTVPYLRGYNFEKIENTNNYSLRIVPKKDKRKDRIILFIISNDGKEIEIVEIDSEHRYKLKK